MLVSICLPVFNGSAYLNEAIESVLDQTHTELELLVADDSSTDNSWEIVQRKAANDPRLKIWRNEERLGLFSNYNRTVGSANGQFIKPFAQDDILSPTAIATLVRALQQNETACMAACGKNILTNVKETGVHAEERVGGGDNAQAQSTETDETNSLTGAGPGGSTDGHYAGLSKGLNPGKLVILKCLAQYRNLIGEPVTVLYRGGIQK
jgi:glycosyltransferase involved in cell wall biosynthesis